MTAAKVLAGTASLRVPYIFAAVFKLYSAKAAQKVVATRDDYLAALEVPHGGPTGFLSNVIISALKLGGPLPKLTVVECGGCFWLEKGMTTISLI